MFAPSSPTLIARTFRESGNGDRTPIVGFRTARERFDEGRAKDVADSVTKPGELAIFEETKATLVTRVARLRTGLAWAEEPASRTRHLITNIELEERPSGELTVRSNFLVYRAQLELDKDVFVGAREDVFRQANGSWKIAKRTILMEDVVLNSGPLSIFF